MEKIIKVFDSEIKSIDEKEGTLTAFISTDAIDRMGDVLDPSGMDAKNFSKNPVVLWAHNYDLPPIGKAIWTKKEGGGVISKVKFAETTFAKEIFQLYKDGFMKAFSVGFIPKETLRATDEDWDNPKKPKRTFKKWELLEYSAVPVPANPEAIALAMQRGVLKDESLKEYFKQEPETEPEPEEVKEVEEKKEPVQTGLDEILAEKNSLLERIAVLEKENSELRYKYYLKLKENQDSLSGMAVENLGNKVVEIMDGVIRKHRGQLPK